jgi:hypothetical protein
MLSTPGFHGSKPSVFSSVLAPERIPFCVVKHRPLTAGHDCQHMGNSPLGALGKAYSWSRPNRSSAVVRPDLPFAFALEFLDTADVLSESRRWAQFVKLAGAFVPAPCSTGTAVTFDVEELCAYCKTDLLILLVVRESLVFVNVPLRISCVCYE